MTEEDEYEGMDEMGETEDEDTKPPTRMRPEYVFYIGVGDLPPKEAAAFVNKMREVMAPLFRGRSVFIPIRKGDSRVELLQPTSLQKRAWDLYIGTITKYGDLLSMARGEVGDQTYRDPSYISVTDSSPIRKKLAELSFAAAKDFAEIEGMEMKLISKPCPECGGTGEMEGMAAEDVDPEDEQE